MSTVHYSNNDFSTFRYLQTQFWGNKKQKQKQKRKQKTKQTKKLTVPERISQNIMKIITAAHILGKVFNDALISPVSKILKSSWISMKFTLDEKLFCFTSQNYEKAVLIKSVFYFTKLNYIATRFATYTLLLKLTLKRFHWCWSTLWRILAVPTHRCFFGTATLTSTVPTVFAWAVASLMEIIMIHIMIHERPHASASSWHPVVSGSGGCLTTASDMDGFF